MMPSQTPESRKVAAATERNVFEGFVKNLRKWAAQGKSLQWPESCTWWTDDIRTREGFFAANVWEQAAQQPARCGDGLVLGVWRGSQAG